MSETILEARSLTKIIGAKTIVDSVSFEVHSGEVFGFLGPNGAGKTTTIRMLVGLIRPTAGEVRICGRNVQKDPENALRCIGCIVETPDLYRFMTGRENLEHFARMMGRVDPAEIDRLGDLTLLANRLDDKVRTYSLGMRQRLGIAVALLGRPGLLILDEPANGLDPVGIREMRQLIRRLAHEEGVGVFVSSHLLSEIEQMCDRVAIIHHGEIIRTGSVTDLIGGKRSMEFRVSDSATASLTMERMGLYPSVDDGRVTLSIDPADAPPIIAALTLDNVDIYEARTVLPTLEDFFLEVTAGESVD